MVQRRALILILTTFGVVINGVFLEGEGNKGRKEQECYEGFFNFFVKF